MNSLFSAATAAQWQLAIANESGVNPPVDRVVHGEFTAKFTGGNLASLEVVHSALFPMISPMVLERTAAEIVLNLLDERDFLGLQLSHALGHMTDETLDRESECYLEKRQTPENEIQVKAQVLVRLIGLRADTETMATALRCDLDQAENALLKVAKMISGQTARNKTLTK